jgi:DNA-directed RNA polymerase specialized sigma24 family protein
MAFPQTRITLVQRLAVGGSEDDWQVFFRDYWGPIFRFCLRRGAANQDVAEEITSDVFQVLWEKGLLERWASNRSAKLRTLICSVTRKLLSQRFRANKPDSLPHEDIGDDGQDDDVFYMAWAEDIVQSCIQDLATDYRRNGKGDYLRVFYGRVCEGLAIREVAAALNLPESSVDYHYRHVRDRLESRLKARVRQHVTQYCPEEEVESELLQEWQRLGEFLRGRGDLEKVLADAYSHVDPQDLAHRRDRSLTKTLTRVTAIRPAPPEEPR